jgi:anti-sigma factor ChrR (cupin superfamily)
VTHVTLNDEQEAQAALYALGSLPADEAAAFERHLRECTTCRRQVDAMGDVCGDLALAPSPRTPSPAVRARVLAEAAGAVARPVAPFGFALETEGDWITLGPGFQRKDLACRPGDRSASYLIRMDPGAIAPLHSHESDEHCYVVSGDLHVAGRHLRGGDYHYAPHGTVHKGLRSDGGCVLLIVEAR